MFKPKTTISGRLENSSGEWIRTTDLRVMSPTSCHCSTPHQVYTIIPPPAATVKIAKCTFQFPTSIELQ